MVWPNWHALVVIPKSSNRPVWAHRARYSKGPSLWKYCQGKRVWSLLYIVKCVLFRWQLKAVRMAVRMEKRWKEMGRRCVVSLHLSPSHTIRFVSACIFGGWTTYCTHPQDHSCVQQLKEHLLSQCKLHSSSNHYEQLSTMLSDPDRPVGLLICERLLNLPLQIGSLLLRSLLLVTFILTLLTVIVVV